MFFQHCGNRVAILIVYVDDIVLIGDDMEEIARLKTHLANAFEVKDLGRLKYFLGIEVAQSSRGIFLSQQKYILDLLKETNMMGCRPAATPIKQNHRLIGDAGALVD